MLIVVDKNIPYVEEAFSTLGEVHPMQTGEFNRSAVKDAEILIVRSETRVDGALLEGSPVRFVGTATIGTDHIDTAYLDAHKIVCANAPGSNANSVSEYVVAALFVLARRCGLLLNTLTIGVVGAGNVGSKVAAKAETLGMKVLLNDPPLARLTGEQRYRPLDELMQADIITLHVPLTQKGPDATAHFFDASRLAALKRGAILINTSRGGVVDGEALARAINDGHIGHTVLDVWEHEPRIDVSLLKHASLGTAHIAGYSLDGKVNAVSMVYGAACRHLKVQPSWTPGRRLPSPVWESIDLPADITENQDLVAHVVGNCYDILQDDAHLRGILSVPEEERGPLFRRLRIEYRLRREFHATTVGTGERHSAIVPTLRGLGFTVRA